jgi:glycosyltransferase involved in cell wall biosynthesis
MKILMLIDRKYPTDHVFLEEVYSKIFSEKGHEVVWVMKSQKPIKTRRETKWNNNRVIVVPTRFPGIIEYVFQIFSLLFLFNLAKKERFDIIQVRNDPVMGILSYFIAKRCGAKFVVQLSHLKAEENEIFAELGMYGSKIKNLLIAKIEKTLRQLMLKKADFVFPISDEMKIYFSELGIDKKKMVSIPLGVSQSISPSKISASKLKQKLGLGNEVVFIYLGTLIKTRKLELMMWSFVELKKKQENVKLLIVGSGKEEEDIQDLQRLVISLDLQKNVIFTGQVPRQEVPKYLKLADVGLSPIPFNKVFKRSSITKLGEYMNMELPVVTTKYPEQEKLTCESKAGYCVDYTIEEFTKALLKMVDIGKKKRVAMGKRGRQYIRKERNMANLAKLVEQRYLILAPGDLT